MSEFKVGDRVLTDIGYSGVVTRVDAIAIHVRLHATVWFFAHQLKHAEPTPSPDYEQHAIDHAVKAMRNAEARAECNIASHEDLAADVHIMEREARKLKEEIRDLKAENSDLRRRIEKLEKKR